MNRWATLWRWCALLVLVTVVLHCQRGSERDGDAAADGHGHHGEHAEADAEPLTITRWQDGYELFVEFNAPQANEPLRYLAHVTDLDGFKAVAQGKLSVRHRQDQKLVNQWHADTLSRPGIFVVDGVAPATGDYQLEIGYQLSEREIRFDCGTVTRAARPNDEPKQLAIGFLKDQQWRIAFGTAVASEQPMAREVELPAIVEPAGTDRLTLSAATAGRFYHQRELKLAEGLHIDAGALVGRIAPAVDGDDFSRLRLMLDESRLASRQAAAELARIVPLVDDGLLPERRAIEARNELARQKTHYRNARERLGRVTGSAGKGGLAVQSSLAGVVAEIFVANGEPVTAGQALMRIDGERSRWVRARFVARPDEPLQDARAVAVRTPAGVRLDVGERARLLSPHPTVDPRTQLATFIAELNGEENGQASHELRSGTHVILLVQVGPQRPRLSVPYSAVVDINTRSYVFVQLGGESFDKRPVITGVRDGPLIEIVEGIQAGERVVAIGGYDVHLASLMGQLESHHH